MKAETRAILERAMKHTQHQPPRSTDLVVVRGLIREALAVEGEGEGKLLGPAGPALGAGGAGPASAGWHGAVARAGLPIPGVGSAVHGYAGKAVQS